MYLIKSKIIQLYQKLTRGWSDDELWNLDVTIAEFVLPRLKGFRANLQGRPSEIPTMEEWLIELDTMIEAFEIIVSDEYPTFEDALTQQVENGLDSFRKYLGSLWQ